MSDSDYEARLKTTGRNDHCPCGSGKKYKKCHSAEDEGMRTAALKALQEEALARAKSSQDTDAEVDRKSGVESTRSTKRQKNESGSQGRASGGIPKNVARRGAV